MDNTKTEVVELLIEIVDALEARSFSKEEQLTIAHDLCKDFLNYKTELFVRTNQVCATYEEDAEE